jgi:hypothetical protein
MKIVLLSETRINIQPKLIETNIKTKWEEKEV